MKTNQAGINIIKKFESCRLYSYQCSAGVWTVGFGHTGPDVRSDMQITQRLADMLLEADLKKFEGGLFNILKRRVTENQFSALVSLTFNIGLKAFEDSTLLLLLNSDAPVEQCASQFLRWDKCKGKTLAGLTKRRLEEKELFLS